MFIRRSVSKRAENYLNYKGISNPETSNFIFIQLTFMIIQQYSSILHFHREVITQPF